MEQLAAGRPVLIGTRSIDKSEQLAELLAARGAAPTVLNARHVEREAEIVSQAGQPGKLTVATNMAGRGTDIRLGPGVDALGGLHVICTELHEAQRIDRQLIGRCGRQGDPGTYRQFLALDDEILLVGFGPKQSDRLKRQGEAPRDRCRDSSRCFAKRSAGSNAATSATARCCSTTKRNGRKRSGKWGRIRISTRRAKPCDQAPIRPQPRAPAPTWGRRPAVELGPPAVGR